MELRQQRQYLTLATACLLAFSAAVVFWSVSAITESTPNSPIVPSREIPDSETTSKSAFAIPAAMTMRQLRAPLYDTEPDPPSPPKPIRPAAPRPKTVPKLQLTLVGTILESGKSLAIITDINGRFDVKGVGETLEIDPNGIVITNIQAEQVTLMHRSQPTVLTLVRKQKKNNGSSGNRNNRKRGPK
jgi:hypothetical protein